MIPVILVAVGVVGVAGLVFWPRIERLLDRRPAVSVGATLAYAGELRAMREMPLDPALSLKPAQQMDADHEALSAISDALDDFDKVLTEALIRFLRHQPKVLLRLPSSAEATGEMPAVVA